MPSIKFDTIVETAKVVSGFRDIQNAVHQTAERVEKDGKSIDDVISNIQNSMNIAIGGWSIGKFVNQMMQVRGQFQQTEMAFKTMLQSEEKADALMKQLIRTAAVTPFGVEDVTEGAKQLLAFNVAAEDVNKTLIGLGDVAAGMGMNLKDLVMLYGTTIAKGKMDTMDLYQFLNRGIPIADELAKVMGLDLNNAIGEVQKQIKAGKVTSDIFIQAMQSMTAEGSKFGGLMEAQSKTITGQISNIKDAIEQMFNDLGKSQEGVINTGLGVVSTLVENWETVGKVLMTVVAAYGAYKAAVIAMIAISKAQVAWESAKAFLSLAKSITTAKDAMALFNMVSSSNVLGLVLGAVAAGVTMFNLFGNSAEDAATKTSKFTESANEASSKVESLVSILKTAKEGSKVYKDTIKELSNIYGNYGIAIDKIKEDESNLVDVKQQEIDKSKELVEQIKLEATERNRANAISKANEDYNNRVDSAQQALLGKLKDYGTSSSGIAVGIQNIVSDSVIKQFDDLTQKMAGLNEHSKEYQTYLKQYNQLEASLISESEKLANAFGFTGDKTSDARKALIGYLYELRAAKKLHSEEADNINRAADATEDFGNKATSTKNRINALQKQLQGAGEDVHVLYNRVKEFMQNYSENNINFHVNFDAKIPSWMQNMNIPELGRLGKYFSALARDLANNKKSGALVNGKWMSTNDIAQRGWDYTNAANTKQTKAEDDAKKKRREKEEVEANAKKNAAKAKKATADAKKQAEDRKKAQEELNEDLKQLQQDNIDNDISIMQEGTEKKIAEIKNDYAKRKAEIDKQEAEFKKKNKEAGKKVTLTSAQSDALNKARDLATQEYNKKLDEVNREALTSMRDYLKEYGSLYQQKQAIAEEYEEKIAKAQTEGEKLSLQQQRKKDLQTIEINAIRQNIDWGSGNGGGVYVIGMNDTTPASDSNVYSARRSRMEFVSRLLDNTAKGTITWEKVQKFLQGILIGNNNAYSIDADGNVIINLLNSADYDDAMQSGFGFYRRKDGKYGLNVTDISVWGKAYFNNLTIRELTYVGGNLVFSPSAGKIFEVREITDAQGEVTGWKCYLLADDGTTATTNMFEVDDQVRCETFNIKAGVYEDVSNKFYWRKITDVSTDNEEIRDSNNNILYDGKKFSWIVISASDKAEGSDNPAAGDTIVLMGNRTNTNRMSFVVKETYGDNAPREVGYTNVHSYTLGNDNLVYEISPKKVRFYSQYFEIVTVEGLPIKTINYRGDWKQGDTYVYYDQVTHNGTTWLCVAPEGTNVTSEPARGNDFWKAQTAILDATLSITQSTGEWIDKGETNHVECSVIRGFENITDQVTSWNIVRDSGDAVNDAAWQNKDKVKNFDGTIDIAWTDDDDDIGDSNSCIFTITAFWGNKVELAKGTISV